MDFWIVGFTMEIFLVLHGTWKKYKSSPRNGFYGDAGP